MTLAAAEILRHRLPDLQLVSFGSSRPRNFLKHVQFIQLPPQDEIRNIYARCDAWVTASRSEGFNLPALEAMACRTPVVSTRTGWPMEAIRTRWNGILVEVGDVEGIVQGVQWLLSLGDREWRKISANAYSTSLEGSWQQSAELFEKALVHACMRSTKREIAGSSLVSSMVDFPAA